MLRTDALMDTQRYKSIRVVHIEGSTSGIYMLPRLDGRQQCEVGAAKRSIGGTDWNVCGDKYVLLWQMTLSQEK